MQIIKTLINKILTLLLPIYKFYKNRNIFLKIIFWIFVLSSTIPPLFIFIMMQTRYRLPDENGFSLEGRSAVVRQSDRLELYKYVSRKECDDNAAVKGNLSNNFTYLKIGKINCAKIYKIKDLKQSPNVEYYQNENNIPTVIMADGTVIYLSEQNAPGKWTIIAYKDGENRVVKEYKVFDLGKFAQDYSDKKVTFDESIKQQTGVIWGNENFKVIDDSTVGFLDAMISEVDGEKPTEAVVRERKLSIFTGEEEIVERERERLDIKVYESEFNGVKNRNYLGQLILNLKWYYFDDKDIKNIGTNFLGQNLLDYTTIERDYYQQIRKIYFSANDYIEYNKKYLVGSDESCQGSFMAPATSCTKWYEQDIKHTIDNVSNELIKQGYMLYGSDLDNTGDMKMIGMSEKKDLIIANILRVHGVPLSDYGITPVVDYKANIVIDLKTRKTALVNYYGNMIYLK
jgi:hypothetical protein